MGEWKSADGETRCSPQLDRIPSHGQRVGEAGYTFVYTDETYGYTSHAVPKCLQDSTTGFKNSGIALPLGLHYNHYLSS